MPGTRGLKVAIAMTLAVGAVGYVSGTVRNQRDTRRLARVEPPPPENASARDYRDMAARKHGPNAEVYRENFTRLAVVPEGPAVPVAHDLEAARQVRLQRRAYDGAPPTIPHEVGQLAMPDCIACHLDGMRVAGRVAPRMSHDRLDSCVMCHVVARDPRRDVKTPAPLTENTFVGLRRQAEPTRAWLGAPPTVPHTTRMRGECVSCHGTFGTPGLQSSHPWRQSCQQCHAPNAELDRRAPVQLGAVVGAR